jgi:hypothetical protein
MSDVRPGTTMYRIAELERQVKELTGRLQALEAQTPAAQRLQYETDVAMADAAEHDRHGPGCGCPYCYIPPATGGAQ